MPFFPPFLCTFFNHHTLTVTLSYITHLSLSLSWGLHCISKHVLKRIVYVLPTTGLVSFLSCHYSSSLSLLPASPVPFLGPLLVLVAVGGALSCLVLASCCLVLSRSKLIDRPFPPRSHRLFPFLVYFTFSLVSYSSTSKRRASLSHTCTTTKFDHSI